MTTNIATFSISSFASLVLLLVGCDPEPVAAAATRQETPVHLTEQGQQPERQAPEAPRIAVCVLRPVGDSGVSGTIEIRSDGERVHLTGTLRGLTPGKHGFHVHEFGDLRAESDGKSAGGHFAPRDNPHGKPTDAKRHVGDLGNIEANAESVATIDLTDDVISLHGPHSILGRSIVVHAKADTFGQPSGDAGDRVAFGVIGIAGAR